MIDRHVMQINSYGLSAMLGVNRVPNVVDRTGVGVGTIRPINEWILPGRNSLDVLLAPAEGDAELQPPEVQVHVFVSDPASDHDKPSATLAVFAWPPTEPVATHLPHVASIAFAVPNPPPCRLWREAADVGALTGTDRGEILALVDRYRAALLARDADLAFRLLEYRHRDIALAHGFDQVKFETDVREQYGGMFDQQHLHCAPLTAAEAVFTIVGAGKVVLVNRGLGTDALAIEAGELPARRHYGIGLYVARVGGSWTIVR